MTYDAASSTKGPLGCGVLESVMDICRVRGNCRLRLHRLPLVNTECKYRCLIKGLGGYPNCFRLCHRPCCESCVVSGFYRLFVRKAYRFRFIFLIQVESVKRY
ncbi:hypothetical protein LOAG_13664 [Loa loa]|uniref:Uncharacterized protein n=1 Tax=Loa loa TaxID=7209 RepID=A0A1S0TIY1_LOALO|nr:hypothetical protein LOAG_13664 [Loa loa]EFO14852.1 hypothetical protein LOAG_13664 [Loa loa]